MTTIIAEVFEIPVQLKDKMLTEYFNQSAHRLISRLGKVDDYTIVPNMYNPLDKKYSEIEVEGIKVLAYKQISTPDLGHPLNANEGIERYHLSVAYN